VVIGRLFGADNRPADNRQKHYWCTSSQHTTLWHVRSYSYK